MTPNSQEAIANFYRSAMLTSFISLRSKPTAKLSYSFIPAAGSNARVPFIVFLNGLGLPASSWTPIMSSLASITPHPAMLSYDRYGQGLSTDRDPLDAKAEDPEHGHDSLDVVRDLRELIGQVCDEQNLMVSSSIEDGSKFNEPPIFFIANSLGGALARLYADQFPGKVSAILFLDSIMANSDFISMFPDPDAPGFEDKYTPLPEGVTEEALRETRSNYERVFHPASGIMGRAEGLSRKNLAHLLPDSDRPILNFGKRGNGPWVTVVGHGFDAFAKEGLKGMGIPIAVTQSYVNPYWHRYNEGLAKITRLDRSKGPVQAEKCGHFIQRDDPEFVVNEIIELLSKQDVHISPLP